MPTTLVGTVIAEKRRKVATLGSSVWHRPLVSNSSDYHHPLKYTRDDPKPFPHLDLSGLLYMSKLRAIFIQNICSEFMTLIGRLSYPQNMQEAVNNWGEKKAAEKEANGF